jgi:hypothetical protein
MGGGESASHLLNSFALIKQPGRVTTTEEEGRRFENFVR